MTAQVIRLQCGVAVRWARYMALDFEPADREQAIEEHMDFATRLQEGGLSHADVNSMIARRHTRLIRQLQELKDI